MNAFNIRRAFEQRQTRRWDKLFWAIDLHDTIISGKYNRYNIGAEVYPGVQEVFEWFARRPDMVPILYTSSHDDAIKAILKTELDPRGIKFAYINENPECPSNSLCNFSNKFYFNILLDDKAGFVGETDWLLIQSELKAINEW